MNFLMERGFSIDIVSYYDKLIRLECSRNHLGETGFYSLFQSFLINENSTYGNPFNPVKAKYVQHLIHKWKKMIYLILLNNNFMIF